MSTNILTDFLGRACPNWTLSTRRSSWRCPTLSAGEGQVPFPRRGEGPEEGGWGGEYKTPFCFLTKSTTTTTTHGVLKKKKKKEEEEGGEAWGEGGGN